MKDNFTTSYHIAELADLTSIKDWYPVDAQGKAGVGVCWNGGAYYYAIVYDFRGTNQNGS